MPDNNLTPENILAEQIRSGQEAIQREFESNLNLLNQQFKQGLIEQKKYNLEAQNIWTQAKQKADDFTGKVTTTQQRLQTLRTLTDEGTIDPGSANRAAWKTMGIDVPKPSAPPTGMPFSPGQQAAYDPTIESYVEQVKPWWFTDVSQNKLITQYLKWRDMQGYGERNPRQQHQLDKIWDAKMRTDPADLEWDPKSADIMKLRVKRTDIFQRVAAGRLSSPLNAHMVKAKPKPKIAPMRFHAFTGRQIAAPAQAEPKAAPIYARNQKTQERLVSNDGGKTWQTAK